jgi:hypothetical protein
MYSLEAKIESREFHTLTGGRHRVDLMFWNRPIAREIRMGIAELITNGQTIGGLAKLLGTSEGTLSKAMGGSAGEKRMEEIREKLQNGIFRRTFS